MRRGKERDRETQREQGREKRKRGIKDGRDKGKNKIKQQIVSTVSHIFIYTHFLLKTNSSFSYSTSRQLPFLPLFPAAPSSRSISSPFPFRKEQASKRQQLNMTKQDTITEDKSWTRQLNRTMFSWCPSCLIF